MKRYQKISRVLSIIFISNITIAIIKISLGLLYKLNSLTADGFHALTDSSSNIIGLIGIKFASKPPDAKHPYGHRKYETIASLMIGIILFYITMHIIYRAIKWFLNPITPNINFISIIPIFCTFIINLFISVYEYKQGKILKSEVLISDSIHTRSDLLISFGVIVTSVLIILKVPSIIDPILSLMIALFIFYSCMQILKATTSILVDSNIIDHEKIIEVIYQEDPNILDVHKIRSRGSEDYIYIDLHIIIPKDKSITYAHDLSHRLQDKLKKVLNKDVELIAHIEPDILD